MRVFLPSRDDTRHHRRRNASKEGGIFFFGLPFLSSSPFRQVFFFRERGKERTRWTCFFFVFFSPLFCFLDWRRSSKGDDRSIVSSFEGTPTLEKVAQQKLGKRAFWRKGRVAPGTNETKTKKTTTKNVCIIAFERQPRRRLWGGRVVVVRVAQSEEATTTERTTTTTTTTMSSTSRGEERG